MRRQVERSAADMFMFFYQKLAGHGLFTENGCHPQLQYGHKAAVLSPRLLIGSARGSVSGNGDSTHDFKISCPVTESAC